MNKVFLTPATLTGHEEIDRQHQALIDMINVLVSFKDGSDAVGPFLETIHTFRRSLESHFTFEEAVLAELGVPHRAGHHKSHQIALADVDDTIAGVEQRAALRPSDVARLFNRVVDDVLKADVHLKTTVAARRAAG